MSKSPSERAWETFHGSDRTEWTDLPRRLAFLAGWEAAVKAAREAMRGVGLWSDDDTGSAWQKMDDAVGGLL